MIIYEVNLTIENTIYSQYYDWLIEHIHALLMLRGFKHAEIAKEKESSEASNHQKITVRYFLASESDLQHYFEHHAENMRNDGIKRFGNQFTATRRIFLETVFLHAGKASSS
jgi:hypothetical protein